MALQDKNVVRTAADLERKYNFAKLLGLSQNIEMNNETLIKVENELNNMLNSLIINLRDVLDQTDISLWFYEGTPTTSNLPYTSWLNPSDHIGDLYYNQSNGYIYKYTNSGWVNLTDIELIKAMALSNAELDTQDHERKVFLQQPTPPYDNGDWWLNEEGYLLICQLAKASGTFEDDDFISANKYVQTIATKDGDIVSVKQGQVVTITDSYAKFTDLATGGSSVINGANITTGTINANLVSIANNNVRIDTDGIKLGNGAKIVGNNGLMNTYIFKNEGLNGVSADLYLGTGNKEDKLVFNLVIPEGLEITKAKIKLYHNPIGWILQDDTTRTGYARNVKLYKANNLGSREYHAYSYSESYFSDTTTYTDTGITWYNNGVSIGNTFTGNSSSRAEAYTNDFSSQFKSNGVTIPGEYEFKLSTSDTGYEYWDEATCVEHTGYIVAILEIDGYMTYS